MREVWLLFKTHLVVNLIALFILATGLGVGLPMMVTSTPHNGLTIVILTLTVVAVLFLYDFVLYKHLGRNALPKRRVRQVIFYFGIAFVVVGFIAIVTQMNFKNEIPSAASTQSQIPNTTIASEASPLDPKLQVTPTGIIDDNPVYTEMTVQILNYSDYVAENITVDIKFGDSLWKEELWKASNVDSLNRLIADQQTKEMRSDVKNRHQTFHTASCPA